MNRLNILPEEILIKIYKECFKNTLLELEKYHNKKLYDNVVKEINITTREILLEFEFEDIDDNEEYEIIGFSYFMLLHIHDLMRG